MEFKIKQIGKIIKNVTGNYLEIEELYRDGLLELDNYNYIYVFWWANEFDDSSGRKVVQTEIPYSKDKIVAGVFACRSPRRPNLIMSSICKIKGVNHSKGRVFIENIDAYANTPIIDIKPYIHCNDRVKNCMVPKWIPAEWGEWLPDKGIE